MSEVKASDLVYIAHPDAVDRVIEIAERAGPDPVSTQ